MDAAEFALELSDLVTTTAWELRGLPSNLNIRISLHAAPVFKVVDPGTWPCRIGALVREQGVVCGDACGWDALQSSSKSTTPVYTPPERHGSSQSLHQAVCTAHRCDGLA